VPVNSRVNPNYTDFSLSGDIQLKNGEDWTVYGAIMMAMILLCIVSYCANLIYRHKVVLEEKANAKAHILEMKNKPPKIRQKSGSPEQLSKEEVE
jgi:hypothetical protein